MAVTVTSGAKFYIGPANSTAALASDFSGLSYTEVKQVQSYGPFGGSRNNIEYQSVGDDIIGTVAGAQRPGGFEIVVNRDPYDAGQVALAAAQATKVQYAAKLVLADKQGSGTNSIYYFRGTVSGGQVTLGGNEDVTRQSFSIANAILPVFVVAT